MQQLKGVILVVGLAALVICGCQTPYASGLADDLSATGTTGTSVLDIAEVPASLTLDGTIEVLEGSLTVVVTNPEGHRVFDRTWNAIAQESISERLEPQVGRWTIAVTSPGGSGSYNVRLVY